MGSSSPTGVAPVVQVHPTRRCNLACAHCYTSSAPDVAESLALDTLTACLDDAAGLGYRQLAVSGGEPLLYKELAELLAHARGLGMLATVTTNGMLATPARWRALAPLLDVVAVSIDGTPPEHDAIRRHDGAFARTVANLEVIRSSGVPFGLIFTLTLHNVDSLEFVVRLAAEHGARSVQVHPLTLHGRAVAMMPGARPDGLELVAALLEAQRLGDELGVVVHVDALTLEQLVAFRGHLVPARPVVRLIDAAPVLVIQADAQVVPMTHEVAPALWLGSLRAGMTDIGDEALRDARLLSLASNWLLKGHAEILVDACEQTWAELTATKSHAAYWYDEVAARTRDHPVPSGASRGHAKFPEVRVSGARASA